jgi:rare lipoprotein A
MSPHLLPAPRVLRLLGALALVVTLPAAGSAAAQAETKDPHAHAARAPAPEAKRLNVRVGQPAVVAGTLGQAAADRVVALQRRDGRRWKTIDRARADAAGRYRLRTVPRRADTAPLRLRSAGTATLPTLQRAVGRLNAYRTAAASWYGPGMYGARTACGATLTAGIRGVAHRTLPCGTRVTLRKGDRIVRARVVDRGPFGTYREFDLTPAVKDALGFGSTGTVEVTV